ncbi:MAG TPA: hypothetical protein VMN60_04870 [Longimicrobiales bacterium]|nr:hypothetical protein [Longimicrobiales bacterium]
MDERVDLSMLELDAEERERLVASVLAHASSELARRATADTSPMFVLYQWARPALAAAAVLALLCLSVLARRAAPTGPGLTDALDVPTPANEWLVADRRPTVADLVVALEGEER